MCLKCLDYVGTQLTRSVTERHYGLGVRKKYLPDDVIQGQMHVRPPNLVYNQATIKPNY